MEKRKREEDEKEKEVTDIPVSEARRHYLSLRDKMDETDPKFIRLFVISLAKEFTWRVVSSTLKSPSSSNLCSWAHQKSNRPIEGQRAFAFLAKVKADSTL